MSEELLPYDSEKLSAKTLDKMVRAAKEKAGIAELKTMRLHKSVIATVTALIVLSLSAITAGAALNWDIFSILQNSRNNARTHSEEMSGELTERKNDFLDKIHIPEGAAAFSEYTDREYEILASLAHEIDLTYDYGDELLHISGYVLDGSCLDIIYDVEYKSGLPKENSENEFYFYSDNTESASSFVPYLLSTEKNTAYYRYRNYMQLADGITSAEIVIGANESFDGDKQNRFTVDIPLDVKTIVVENLDIDDNVHLNRFVLSPLGAFMELSESVEYIQTYDSNAYPIYVTYEDGTVIDLSDYTGNFEGGAGYLNEDGRIVLDYAIGRNMNIFDAEHIASIQIFNEIIEL